MLRKLALLLGVFFLVSISAKAQDKVELFGGYSYLRLDNSPSFNLNGWEFSGQYKFTDWLGAVTDFDGHYGSPFGPSVAVHTFLVGPQVSFPARVSPFAHVLIGGGHAYSGGITDNSFAMAVGGGIDTRLTHGIFWRIFQADYHMTNFFGTRQDNARVSTGIVFHF
jgi:opacity protein-like surface antigen